MRIQCGSACALSPSENIWLRLRCGAVSESSVCHRACVFGNSPVAAPCGSSRQCFQVTSLRNSPIPICTAPVQFIEGPFQGLEVVITQLLPARERIRVLLEFLGRSVEMEVPAGKVLAA